MSRDPLLSCLSIAAVALCILLAPSVAWSGAATAGSTAAALYADQEYERAITAADAALAAKGTARPARITALRVKGSALAVLGRDSDAAAAFIAVLELDPAFQLPRRTSPRIRGVFGAALAKWQVRREGQLAMKLGAALTALALEVQTPLAGHGGRAYVVRVGLTDPQHIAKELVLYYRRVGTQRYSTATVTARHGASKIPIPGAVTASTRSYQLELYVQVVHASGVTLRRHGRPARPLRVSVRAGQVPKQKPLVKRWWFWTGIAAVALSIPFVVDQMRDVGPQDVTGTLR